MDRTGHRRRGGRLALAAVAVAALMLVALVPQSYADYTWNDALGPGNDDVRALVYDPSHGGGVLYRATSGRGVWKYQGGVWSNMGGGLTDCTVVALAYDPARNILYAGTHGQGVWRCSNPDTSPSWTDMSGTGLSGRTIFSLACDSAGNILYAGTHGQGVWRCSGPNSSSSWTNTGGGVASLNIHALLVSGGNLYAGTGGGGVWRCSDPGSSPAWTGLGGGLSGYTVRSLAGDGTRLYAGTVAHGVWRCSNPAAVSPAWSDIWNKNYSVYALYYQGSSLYAGLLNKGVMRCDNPNPPAAGTTPGWSYVAKGIGSETVYSLADGPGDTVYAGTGSRGVVSCATPTATPSWTGAGAPLIGRTVNSLAYDSANNIIYAGTEGHGVWRCTNPDTAPNWVQLAGGPDGEKVRSVVLNTDHNIVYAAVYGGTEGGVWRCATPNSSPSWTNMTGDLPRSTPPGLYNVSSLVYAPRFTYPWPFGTRYYLYAGTAEGVWRCNAPHTNSDWNLVGGSFPTWEAMSGYTSYALTHYRTGSGEYLFASTGGDGVWRHTQPTGLWLPPGWENMAGLYFQSFYAGIYDDVNGRLYQGCSGNRGVLRCDNPTAGIGLVSWNVIGGEIKAWGTLSLAANANYSKLYSGTEGHGVWRTDDPGAASPGWTDIWGSDYSVNSLVYDGSRLYAATKGHGVFRCDSPNVGSIPSWSEVKSGVSDYTVRALVYDAAGNALFAGCDDFKGVWRYDAGAGAWVDIGGGIGSLTVKSLAYDGTRLYAGTWAHGVWRCDDPFTPSPSWKQIGYNVDSEASGTAVDLNGICSRSTGEAWAVGAGGVVRYFNGSNWAVQTSGTSANLNDIAFLEVNRAWAVGDGGTIRYYNGSWSGQASGTGNRLNGVCTLVAETGRAWAVGDSGTVLYFDGTSWGSQASGTGEELNDVCAVSTDNVWAVGDNGTIIRYDGTNWGAQASGTGADLNDVSGLVSNRAWAVGSGGTILHFNGSSWSSQASGTSEDLNGVYARTENDVLAVGDGGTILRYDGAAWRAVAGGTTANLTGLAQVTPVRYLISGSGGTILRTGDAVNRYDINTLAFGGSDLYAGTEGRGLWRCDNPETSPDWKDTGGISSKTVKALAYDGSRIYAGLSDGIWRCESPGTAPSWTNISGALSGLPVNVLAHDGSRLFAGIQGVWRCDNPADAAPPFRWVDAGGAVRSYRVYSLLYEPVSGVLMAGTGGHGVWRLVNPGFDPSSAPTWLDTGGSVRGYTLWSLAYDGAGNLLYAGTEKKGTRVASLDRIPTVISCSPARGDKGTRVNVDIYGAETDFTGNAATFGPGITVNSTTVVDATHATADITISPDAVAGARDVNVVGSETPEPLVGGFTVVRPRVDHITPKSAYQTETLDVLIWGRNTNFVQGASRAVFSGSGITVNSTTVVDATHATANVTVSSGAAAGLRDVNVITGTESPDPLVNGFEVKARATRKEDKKKRADEEDEEPSALSTWYLAEGSTDWGFDCYVVIENPNDDYVTAEVTYMTEKGPVEKGKIRLPALSQTTFNPADDLGAEDFSTRVVCTEGKPIAVDRTMTWTEPASGLSEAHSSIGVTSPAETWYLPEGSSAWGFETWLLIQNPNPRPASCTVTYMIEGEGPRMFSKTVPANSRSTFSMEADVGRKDASIKVESDRPVIPERATYRNNRREGHGSIGTTRPAASYFLAEGSTDWGFTTYILVQNPNKTETGVNITYLTEDGPVAHPRNPIVMPPNSRKTVRVNDFLPGADFSTRVDGSAPIIAERAMYWGEGTALGEACHDSIGMADAHKTFYLPDGDTRKIQVEGGESVYETWTLVANPNPEDVTVEISYLTPTGKGNVTFEETVPANSRRTFSMAEKIPGGRAAVLVRSKTAGKKIMVERAMYQSVLGYRVLGTGTIGGYSD